MLRLHSVMRCSIGIASITESAALGVVGILFATAVRGAGIKQDGLAPLFADTAGLGDLAPGHRVLDVGCGSGALAVELAGRVGDRTARADWVATLRARDDAREREIDAQAAAPWNAHRLLLVAGSQVFSSINWKVSAPTMYDSSCAHSSL